MADKTAFVGYYPVNQTPLLPGNPKNQWNPQTKWLQKSSHNGAPHWLVIRAKQYHELTAFNPPPGLGAMPLMLNGVVQIPPAIPPTNDIMDISQEFEGKFRANWRNAELAAQLATVSLDFFENVIPPKAIFTNANSGAIVLKTQTCVRHWIVLVSFMYAMNTYTVVPENLGSIAASKANRVEGITDELEQMHDYLMDRYVIDREWPMGICIEEHAILHTNMRSVRDYFKRHVNFGIWSAPFLMTQKNRGYHWNPKFYAGLYLPVAYHFGKIYPNGGSIINSNNTRWYLCEPEKVRLRAQNNDPMWRDDNEGDMENDDGSVHTDPGADI